MKKVHIVFFFSGPSCHSVIIILAPGPVSALKAMPNFGFLVLTWRAPEEPNGAILGYRITYRFNASGLLTSNVEGTSFTISSLAPSTDVRDISVTPYNSIGEGGAVTLPHVVTTLEGL
jgi:hypothetical protein